jgi:hypothetical protein
MAGLKDGADLDGKGLAALVALVGANPGAFAFHLGNALYASAMRANGTVRPDARFYEFVGSGFIVKMVV